MKKRLCKTDSCKTGRWSGGTSTELAIYPQGAEYLDRDFIWRLSSSEADQEESSFAKLPDFDRILMVIEGDVVLAYGDRRSVKLGPFEQDRFDGAVKTKCFGNLKKDYSLIMRKGCKGRMEIMEAAADSRAIELTGRAASDKDGLGGECASAGCFVLEGYVVVSVDGSAEMVREGEQYVVDCQPEERPALSIMGEGRCIFTEVIFEKQPVFFEDVPDAKASRGDFAAALKLSLGNNKWNKIVKRAGRKGEWYDPLLESKLKFLDKFMLTSIIWVIGVLLCICTLMAGWSSGTVFVLIVLFTLVHIFLLRPLIYMIVLPKPISAHIKKQSELRRYEQELFEEQLDRDDRREKLLYRYRDRSGEQYEGRADFIKKLNK